MYHKKVMNFENSFSGLYATLVRNTLWVNKL